jgi:hypothetical protein
MSESIFPDLGGDDISADSTVIPCSQEWVERVKNGLSGNGFKTDAEIEKERQEEQRKLAQEAYKAAEWLKKNGADPRQLDQLSNQQVVDLYNAVQRGDSSVTTGGVTINIQPIGPGAPALKGDPYHPDIVRDRVRPPYRANPAHDPKSPLFNPRKTPEPPDAANVYQNSVRADIGTWYGRSADGKFYRYFSDNAGGAHFSGIVPKSRVPREVLKELGR